METHEAFVLGTKVGNNAGTQCGYSYSDCCIAQCGVHNHLRNVSAAVVDNDLLPFTSQ